LFGILEITLTAVSSLKFMFQQISTFTAASSDVTDLERIKQDTLFPSWSPHGHTPY